MNLWGRTFHIQTFTRRVKFRASTHVLQQCPQITLIKYINEFWHFCCRSLFFHDYSQLNLWFLGPLIAFAIVLCHRSNEELLTIDCFWGRKILFFKNVASAVPPNSIGWHHTQKCVYNTNCTWVIKIIRTENTNWKLCDWIWKELGQRTGRKETTLI